MRERRLPQKKQARPDHTRTGLLLAGLMIIFVLHAISMIDGFGEPDTARYGPLRRSGRGMAHHRADPQLFISSSDQSSLPA